jgi:hypothetical protein
MVHALGVLARAQLQIGWNTLWRGSLGKKIGVVAALLALGLGAFGLYWLMSAVVGGLTSPAFSEALREAAAKNPGVPTDIRPYLDAVPAIALFGALAVLLLTSFSTVLSSLYLSRDLDLLLLAPVPTRAVFVVKLFAGLVVPYLVLFVLLGPALVGYGAGLGYGLVYYLALLVVLALFPLLPAALGVVLVMAVVRVVPARRAREIVGLLGVLAGASWYVVSQLGGRVAAQLATVQTVTTISQLDNPLLPSAWAGRALVAAGRGDGAALALYGGVFVAASLGLFGGCVWLAERLYYIGWTNMAAQGGTVRRRAADDGPRADRDRWFGPVFRLLSSALPPESRAILRKDLRSFPRDLRNLQQLIFPLIMAGVWIFQLVTARPGPAEGVPPALSTLSSLTSVGIGFFVAVICSSALAGPGISREGQAFWLLKVAPVSGWRILLGKFVLAYLPFIIVGTLMVVLFAVLRPATLADAPRALALIWLLGMGTTAISLGLGAAFPRLDWQNPSQQTTTRAGCLSLVLYTIYIGLGLGAAIGLPALAPLVPQLALPLAIAGWLILLALTALVTWGALAFGAARLDTMEV